MQYDVKTPEEYLNTLDNDWRKTELLKIRHILSTLSPNLKESIQYKMLGYSDERGLLFCLNAQKHYVSLYIGDASKVDPTGELLENIDVGKGCLRFKKSKPVETTRIDEFIKKTYKLWLAGQDVDC
jgi:uncharacterized protein YdhG (YjbR/CyaY superfamily)